MCLVTARPALLLLERKHLEIKWDPAFMRYVHYVLCPSRGTIDNGKIIRFFKSGIAEQLFISRGVLLPNRA